MIDMGTPLRATLACIAAAISLAGCSSHPEAQSPPNPAAPKLAPSSNAPQSATQAAVRTVVERFGKRMQTISILAPPDDVRGELEETYGQLITPELMTAWKAHPDTTIGREGSSPWPTQIVIRNVDCGAPGTCHVTGMVDYITSNELEHGGVSYRRAIALEVTRSGPGWRIAAVELGPAPR